MDNFDSGLLAIKGALEYLFVIELSNMYFEYVVILRFKYPKTVIKVMRHIIEEVSRRISLRTGTAIPTGAGRFNQLHELSGRDLKIS